jgi:hypothetical protein
MSMANRGNASLPVSSAGCVRWCVVCREVWVVERSLDVEAVVIVAVGLACCLAVDGLSR